METTWKPHEEHGKLSTAEKNDLPENVFAFPKQKKEAMTDASHVRNAMARCNQVKDISDEDPEQSFASIKKAAKHYTIDMQEKSWKDFGKK